MSRSHKFFDHEPSDWQELESLVHQAFAEMGYESSKDHEIQTVRGKVHVDVFAIKRSTPIATVVVCECKHWRKPVDQGVVHTLRSVCGDVGAHFGLIISKAGFQSGAHETREATNVHLLNFGEFQEKFFQEWKAGMFMRIVQMADPLYSLLYNPYTEKSVAIEQKVQGINLFRKYAIFFGKTNYNAFFINDGEFPVELTDPRGSPRDLTTIAIQSHRHFYELCEQGAADARKHFGV